MQTAKGVCNGTSLSLGGPREGDPRKVMLMLRFDVHKSVRGGRWSTNVTSHPFYLGVDPSPTPAGFERVYELSHPSRKLS